MTDQYLAQALAETAPARALELLAAAELALANDVLIAGGLRDGAPSDSGTSSCAISPIDAALRDANAAFVQALVSTGLSARAAELLAAWIDTVATARVRQALIECRRAVILSGMDDGATSKVGEG